MKTTKKKFTISGREIDVWSIKHLAEALRRTTQTIVIWERRGKFPKPLLKTPDGLRWYTRPEISVYGSLAVTYGLGSRTDTEEFFRAVFDRYRQLRAQLAEHLRTGAPLEDSN